jgi:hypothetical protein
LNDWAVLGDVQESDFALVLALVRGHDVLDVELRVRPVVVDHQLTPERLPERLWAGICKIIGPIFFYFHLLKIV